MYQSGSFSITDGLYSIEFDTDNQQLFKEVREAAEAVLDKWNESGDSIFDTLYSVGGAFDD